MADGYAPVPSPDDEEERRRLAAAYPAPSPVASPSPAPPTPALGSTADLEARVAQPHAYPAPEPAAPTPAPSPRPQWSQYAPAERHGWGKFGSIMASLNPISNEIVNRRPMENAERNYKAATSDFDKTQADQLAQTKEEREGKVATADIGLKEAETEKALHPEPKEPDKPLDNPQQMQQMLTRRFQVLHPGQALDPSYVLPPNATNKHYEMIDKGLEAEERALGVKQTHDTAEADRTQTHADQQANLKESRAQRQSNFDISREDRQAREEQARTDKLSKPTADEQRRADLTENLNENLGALEDIVNRKPDLFGPYHGRITSLKAAIGTDDPDIAALETIKHQLGMAQISAHGMRSAQGIAAASDSILNSFHNSPDAVRGAINAARKSVGTFTADVERVKAGGQAGGGKAPAAGTVENGYRFKGGDPSKKENWEKAQ